MASRAVEVWEHIAGLSELMAAARKTLAELGDDDNPHTELQRANLKTTITAVERELVLARQSLQGARGLDAVADTLARLKEGRLAAGQTQTQGQKALDRTIAPDAVKAILTSANVRAKKRRPRKKKDWTP